MIHALAGAFRPLADLLSAVGGPRLVTVVVQTTVARLDELTLP